MRPDESVLPLFLYYFFCLEDTKQFVRNIAVYKNGQKLGLTQEELAFYDALTKPEHIQDFYQRELDHLKDLEHECAQLLGQANLTLKEYEKKRGLDYSSYEKLVKEAQTWYNDLENGIHETTEFLELFLRNLLLGEQNPLHNRTLHISGAFKEPEKANIGDTKANFEAEKANIKKTFNPKTAAHVLQLLETFRFEKVFGRSDVQRELGLKPTRSSELLHEMAENGITVPVSGFGKGKYRFRSVLQAAEKL